MSSTENQAILKQTSEIPVGTTIAIAESGKLLFVDPRNYRDGNVRYKFGCFYIEPMRGGLYNVAYLHDSILLCHQDQLDHVEKRTWYKVVKDLIVTDSKSVAVIDLTVSNVPLTILDTSRCGSFIKMEVLPDPVDPNRLCAIRLGSFV